MKQPEFIMKEDIERGKAIVCSFIITHLDEYYHRLLKNSTDDPKFYFNNLIKPQIQWVSQ